MIVADTSALIEYYRPGGDEEARKAVAEAIATDRLTVNGVIQVEIVSFARSEADRRRLAIDFQAFHWLELTRLDFEVAQDLGFELRRLGLTIPATDLIIAASTIRSDTVLYHLDSHFDLIAQNSDLQVRSFLRDGAAARSKERPPGTV